MAGKWPFPSSKNEFSASSGLGFAYRIGMEFISGILAGLLIGYGIDYVFDISPWGMVVMVILGGAAGMLTIFRLLGMTGKKQPFPHQKKDLLQATEEKRKEGEGEGKP